VAVRNVISDLEGSYALAILWAGAPTSLVVARRQAPLIIGLGEGEFICASDTPAIANFTNIILPMEDEEIALLTPLGIEIYDSNNERQYRSPVSLKVSEQIMDKMNFKHYMLKEIYDQPQTAKNWLENYLIKNLDNGQYQINYAFDTEFFESIERIEIIENINQNNLWSFYKENLENSKKIDEIFKRNNIFIYWVRSFQISIFNFFSIVYFFVFNC